MQVALDVRVTCRGMQAMPGRLLDISVSGAFLALPAPPPALRIVHVEVLDLHAARPLPRLRAQVVRSCADGVGIEWDPQALAAVRDLLLPGAAADPDSSAAVFAAVG